MDARRPRLLVQLDVLVISIYIYHPSILHGSRDTISIPWGKFGEDLQQEIRDPRIARFTWSYLVSPALLSDTIQLQCNCIIIIALTTVQLKNDLHS